jgi:2,4-dienoyl-CoA reductase (NADPH2)
VGAEDLAGYDDVLVATGIAPRTPAIPGIDHPKVASYVEIVEGRKVAGAKVAIVGAGGIGFDVAEFLTAGNAPDGHLSDGAQDDPAIAAFRNEWGIDAGFAHRGGLKPAHENPPPRQVWLLQRKDAKVGAGLAKTTGWIRRTLLKRRGVAMLSGVEYEKIDDAGLHIRVDGAPQVLAVDTIVICAGQEPRRDLVAGLEAAGIRHQLIGGADVAEELDAKRAIAQGTRVALAL